MRSIAWLLGAGLLLGLAPATAQVGDEGEEIQQLVDFGLGNRDGPMDDEARNAWAENNFDSIMLPQNEGKSAAQGRGARRPAPRMRGPETATVYAPAPAPGGPGGVTISHRPADLVEMPLRAYEALRQALARQREQDDRQLGPAVVLGAADYRGEALEGALRLDVRLQVTLGRPGTWKTVPLIGDDAVLMHARVGGKPVPVSRRAGYHVWVTRETGEVPVELAVLVPARGPRGSIEYDFLVARSPVTRFQCRFPVAGLEPRLGAAVQAESRPDGTGTLVIATLRPTTRIHLVGFKDLGAQAEQAARVYAETMNLLSVDEDALELFTVVRYTILYAGTKSFDVLLPRGMNVVSADGMGAFRFALEPHAEGQLLKGETEFPIRNSYEISLRLRREGKEQGQAFDAPLPHCQGVERESGWLAVEVPGKLQLEERSRSEVMAVDVRQLPEEMVRSAVSPILKAYRYHSPAARVALTATRLPEIEPESGSIDRVRAFTKVTEEGNVITDLRVTLRNRLRHSLKLALPAGSRVSSALLDGQPFNPSQDEAGRLLLPLKRSRGQERLQAFTLSVILESRLPAFGLMGLPELALPAVDLPVSSLAWTLYLPAQNLYTRPRGDIAPQEQVGQAVWHQPAARPSRTGTGPRSAFRPEAPADTADAGAMPVRFQIPKDGKKLEYARYWIEREQPVAVWFGYLRGWLRIPAWLGLAALAALGLWLFSRGLGRSRVRLALGAAVLLGGLVGAGRLGGQLAVWLGLLGGFGWVALDRGWPRRAPEALGAWGRGLGARWRQRRSDPRDWTARRVWWRMGLAIGLVCFGLVLLDGLWELAWLLLNPLP
jgi:hypothetical protein